MTLAYFFRDILRALFRGPLGYRLWVGCLLALIGLGGWFYYRQLAYGLVVTNLTDQVPWGFYIANFTFVVGVAAAAVLLTVPAYVFDRRDIRTLVLMGDSLAIAAVIMAVLFVFVDLGRPDRIWHILPGIGRFNFPHSMLAWDLIVLGGYLLLNLGISFYILFCRYRGRYPRRGRYFPFVLVAIVWAIAIHTVTAFLFAANPGRDYWHSALLAPRFIASAFCSGPALMIVALQIVKRVSNYPVPRSVIDHLALVMTLCLQITLFFVLAELFTDFYHEGKQAASARYLYLGLDGHRALVPWIRTALVLLGVATLIGSLHPLRRHPVSLNLACVLTIVGVWIEKGMGLVVPGFVPTPVGELSEYTPGLVEIAVAAGIWGIGLLLFTLSARVIVLIEGGRLRATHVETPGPKRIG